MYKYIPIIRPRSAERRLIDRLSVGFEQFDEENSERSLLPCLEITEPGVDLTFYESAQGRLLVDFPEYLSQRSTAFEASPGDDGDEGIDEFLDQYNRDPVQFFEAKAEAVDIPVLSPERPEPVVFADIHRQHRELRDQFDELAVRLFVPFESFDDRQQENLAALLADLRPNDIVLIDILSVASFNGDYYDRIQSLVDDASGHETYVLNAFEPRESVTHNNGPVLALELGLAGFGDFATDSRYPSGGAAGDSERDSILRQYDDAAFEVKEYSAETYPEALNNAQADGSFDPDHCEFCNNMASEDRDWSEIWKTNSMGHYISEVVDYTLPDMVNTGPENLDATGYQFVASAREE